jgi:hypothetical protein
MAWKALKSIHPRQNAINLVQTAYTAVSLCRFTIRASAEWPVFAHAMKDTTRFFGWIAAMGARTPAGFCRANAGPAVRGYQTPARAKQRHPVAGAAGLAR